jgi:adenine-specific DNA-methyltransferase
MASKKETPRTSVDTLKHKDKRVNIPTEELRDFVAEYEAKPKTLLYPCDPSLDPQLVWKGKDEQDSRDLAVPAVPIYIQEKIQPKAIIENVRAEARKEKQEPQIALFADFNGIEFEDLADFYKHEQNWSNRMILGDSLLVMSSLAEKEGLKGKVQMIYIDPPYGIKFGSNWQVSTRKRDVKDGKAEDLTRQPEQIRAFRDTWKLGIHSYLAYLRDRLVVARELLTETGSIFVQIGDENVHLVRCLMDEVFGGENFCAQVIFRKTTGKGSALLDNTFDVLLWYGKNRDYIKYRTLYIERRPSDDENYRFVEMPDGLQRALTIEELARIDSLPKEWKIFSPNPLTSQSASSTTLFEYDFNDALFKPGKGGWKTNEEGMKHLYKAKRLTSIGHTLRFIRYFKDFPFQARNDIWDDTRQSGFGEPKIYVVQTMARVIERCLLMTTDPGDLVLDPTCGSGTTAYVAEQWGMGAAVDNNRYQSRCAGSGADPVDGGKVSFLSAGGFAGGGCQGSRVMRKDASGL